MSLSVIHPRKLTIVIIVISVIFPISSFSNSNYDTGYFELDNGLKVLLYEKHTVPLINIVIAVNVGTKDETENTNGLIHILEHTMLFGQTEQKSGKEIISDLRNHGAYFNAHTGRDLSVFDLTLPSEHIDFGLNNQKEMIFNLKITQRI